jgi:hypothetical protein
MVEKKIISWYLMSTNGQFTKGASFETISTFVSLHMIALQEIKGTKQNSI